MSFPDALLNQLAANLQQVRQRMHAACQRSARASDAVRLVAVTKTAPVDCIRAFLQAAALKR